MAGSYRAYSFYRMIWGTLDWVLPPRCVGCDKPGLRWCPECLAKTSLVTDPICPKCGLPEKNGRLCRACERDHPCYTALRSWARYTGAVAEAIRRLKYRRDLGLGDSLAGQMLPALRALGWGIDMILPIPLSKARHADRGYNQAGLIARPLALALGLPYTPKALARWRETRSQVGLTGEQRHENVRGAFRAQGRQVRARRILLIDDVATTGSTLSSAAEALLLAGAAQVYAFTAARAVGSDDPAGAGMI